MENTLKVPAHEMDHRKGSRDFPLILVQYGDYECPYSAALEPGIQKLLIEFKKSLCYVYRHFPLRGIHPMSTEAAMAAEAAGRQDKFWEMHELLFQNSDDLSHDLIQLLARKLNLNIHDFYIDMENADLMEKVERDHQSGMESGVTSTPTLFINGYLYQGSSSYLPLKEALNLALNNNQSSFY